MTEGWGGGGAELVIAACMAGAAEGEQLGLRLGLGLVMSMARCTEDGAGDDEDTDCTAASLGRRLPPAVEVALEAVLAVDGVLGS